ncbi:E3 ubiquitin-protein ligase BRE1-like 1 [Durio zibethinus]|uniref:E3 ubiquitin-protein ligase BRE1-like 1 n=1 Tax=Durio zibethinus TaxID=66656 RepID=A0A6P6AL33_DURZI|nr:E3 ubiquitin-protein ligase BRE1-like 1 [Durio zibethinus]XP_022765543.1 E3 ubiquitin-protein ligase BRE1-like 1 [Durio zibethinus]
MTADVVQRSLDVADSRTSHLGAEIECQIDERKKIEAKLEEASREPDRKMYESNKYKEVAMDIHSIQADVQSLSSILDRKVQDLKGSD